MWIGYHCSHRKIFCTGPRYGGLPIAMWANLAALVFQKPAAVCESAAAAGQAAMAAWGGGGTETSMDVKAPRNGR